MENKIDKSISVIVPAYNEEKMIAINLQKIYKELDENFSDFEIVVVNDGSFDGTKEEIIKTLENFDNIFLVDYSPNRGKGGAIREGVNYVSEKRDFIAFLDADLDIGPEHVTSGMKIILETDADVVIGSKMHKNSRVDYPILRRIASYCYYLLIYFLFHMKIKDTQTGVKIFKANLLKSIINRVRTSGFAFDIEILVILNQMGNKIVEMPVVIKFSRDKGFERIKIKDILIMFENTINIYWRLKIKRGK